MPVDQEPRNIPFRKPGESQEEYRSRIARFVPKKDRPKQTKDTAIHNWRENGGTDLVIQAYYGWESEAGEEENDKKGANINHGQSPPEGLAAKIALTKAADMTIGTPITSLDLVREIRRTFRIHEADFDTILARKRDFEDWAKEELIERKGLKQAGESLRKTV